MSQGTAKLDKWARQCGTLQTLVTDGAPAVARELEADIRKDLEKGRAPGGKAWKKTVDGARAFPGAASGVSVEARGTTVVCTVGPPYVHGELGAYGRKRGMLPTDSEYAADAIERGLGDLFDKRVG